MSMRATPPEGPATGAAAPPAFQQRLGLFDATMLVSGSMIGSGIFLVSADIARDVGSAGWLLVVWVLSGVMTVIGALSYAELAAMMPHAGGQYVYLREAYGPLWGFLYGWTLFLVIQTGTIAAVLVTFGTFLGVLVPELGPGNVLLSVPYQTPGMVEPWKILGHTELTISAGHVVAVGVVVFLTLLNCRGVQQGKWVQNIFTVAKTLALAGLIVVGLTVAANSRALHANYDDCWEGMHQSTRFQEVHHLVGGPGLLAMWMVAGGAMVGSLFASDAWNNVTFTAGEVRNPRRNLPLSLALGTGMVTVLYLLANLGYMSALPVRGNVLHAVLLEWEAEQVATDDPHLAEEKRAEAVFARGIDHAKQKRVGTAVLELVSPDFGLRAMAVAIIISTFGCANGLILMGARLYYAMAQDGLFFQSIGRLNRYAVPAAGLILQGLWTILLIFSGTYSELLDYVIFAALLFYVLTVTGLFILRRKRPDAERPYRAFGYPVIPAIYVILCAVIMFDLLIVKPMYTWPGLIIVLTGIPVYFLWNPRAAARGLGG